MKTADGNSLPRKRKTANPGMVAAVFLLAFGSASAEEWTFKQPGALLDKTKKKTEKAQPYKFPQREERDKYSALRAKSSAGQSIGNTLLYAGQEQPYARFKNPFPRPASNTGMKY